MARTTLRDPTTGQMLSYYPHPTQRVEIHESFLSQPIG
jgi:hypothetical protein